MIKVLYLLNIAGKGGTERYIRNLVEKLDGDKIKAYFAYNQEGMLLDWMEARGVPCFRLEMRRPFDFKAAKLLADYCRNNEIDVIHTHYLRENYIALLAKKHYKKVRVVNTYHILGKDSTVVRVCTRVMSRSLDCQIANCSAGVRQLEENGVPKKKIRLVYNAVEPSYWKGDGKSTLRDEIGTADDEFIMFYAARFVPGKGHAYLIDAVRRLKALTDRPFRLVLAGDGELEDDVKKSCADMDTVCFMGYRTDMPNLYRGADLTVCPSENETLSLLLLESMAAGTPVLATAVGGMTDIVTEENVCGLLVPPRDSEAMARAMLRFMSDEEFRVRCARGGEKAVREKFSLDAVCGQITEIYSGVEK